MIHIDMGHFLGNKEDKMEMVVDSLEEKTLYKVEAEIPLEEPLEVASLYSVGVLFLMGVLEVADLTFLWYFWDFLSCIIIF